MKLINKSPDLVISIIVCLLALVVALSGMQNALRVLLTIPLAFILPGYTLVAAIYGQRTLATEIHIVFAIALSVSMIALGGLLLNFTDAGLNTTSWLIYLSVLTLVASGLALLRRQRSNSFTSPDFSLNFSWSQAAMCGMAVVLAFVAIRTARIGIDAQPRESFTELWMLPPTQDEVQIGIQNEEGILTSYRLVVRSGDDVLAEWNNVELKPGEQWQEQFSAAGQPNIEASLYRTFEPDTVYRTVALSSELSS